ncbi:CYTH and CHAD domain-containing protein [Mycolicibacterium neoaurum]|uniref:CYTH and CHAD domain-containing protein n=1 Tax=Mycolicibacterium neoaurum TaxID=1795 RepID=UPI00248C149E|nr:CYTH and CHAD domain-containing protein [Mycolicibacterium neoaurum]WBP93857.1 CYTH and CHAD domain-containing protein [Mycolicibacterium neoaurum]WBS07650.1 CYTH and CHAD domain-containing protein [Mycolicibacterium neoaurum]
MPADKPKTSRHTEVERKFDVVESTVSPSFEGLAVVSRVQHEPTQLLEAVYYDTPSHDLAAYKITLRRRTGGADEGWHVKLPAGPDARTEVRAPLADSVPEDIRDVVAAIVRDRPLSAVARITTNRTVSLLFGADGTPLAEFCDDQVDAAALRPDSEPQTWREWELELIGAPRKAADLLDRLANRLLDAGAVPAGHGSKLARVLATGEPSAATAVEASDPVRRAVAENVAELLVWDRAVRADAWDSVHQMRVTTRKIRSLLADESFGLPEDSWILDELKLLAGILGVARDAEVLAEKYEKALDSLAPELVRGPVRARLVDGAKARYAGGWRRSLMAMRSERYFRLLDGLDELVAAPSETTEKSGSESAAASMAAAYKKVQKAAKAAADDGTDESLHRIRKRAKRLRYTASAIGDTAVEAKAKTIQSLLGDHQDSVVSRTHLLHEADAAHAAGEDTFTYGVLYQKEVEVALEAEAGIDEALASLKKAVKK